MSGAEAEIAVVEEEEEETQVAAVKADGEGCELDPARVRDEILDFLDDLSAAEDTGSEAEEERTWRKYHHLPWRGRCWSGDLIRIPRRASRRSSEDTRRYRTNYPDIQTGKFLPFLSDNSEFYTNRRRAYPCGEFIDVIHSTWWGKYRKLETQKDYIEWLFPVREIGTNWHAQDLQKREIKTITNDWQAHNRVLTSYEMMLDFYGMRLKDHARGTVERAPGWRERFKCLNKSNSCHRHITRMLKCLGELNHENLKAPFVEFILQEAITKGTLPNTLDSCMEYWVEVLRSPIERRKLKKLARQLAREHNRQVLETREEMATSESEQTS